MECRTINNFSDLSFDTVDQFDTEDAIICLLKQIRFLLLKLSNSIAPAIDITNVKKVSTELSKLYKATSTKVVEIQNISHLTDSPNDLILQPKVVGNNTLGLVIRPGENIRIFLRAGDVVFASFKDRESYIALNEFTI